MIYGGAAVYQDRDRVLYWCQIREDHEYQFKVFQRDLETNEVCECDAACFSWHDSRELAEEELRNVAELNGWERVIVLGYVWIDEMAIATIPFIEGMGTLGEADYETILCASCGKMVIWKEAEQSRYLGDAAGNPFCVCHDCAREEVEGTALETASSKHELRVKVTCETSSIDTAIRKIERLMRLIDRAEKKMGKLKADMDDLREYKNEKG